MTSTRKTCLLITLALLTIPLSYLALKKTSPPHVTLMGPVLMADGLGRMLPELIDALYDDMDVGFIPTGSVNLEGTPQRIHKILKNKTATALGKVVIFLECLGVHGGSSYKKLGGVKNEQQIRIAYSMFESTQIPSEWVHIINHHFDAVAVPDPFLVKIYKESGITLPVFVIPLALNLEKFFSRPLKSEKKSPLVFANLGMAIPRKNQLKLIQAFHLAFGNSNSVKLRINSRRAEDPTYLSLLKEEIIRLGLSNVDLTVMTLDKELYLKTFENTDCYVSVSTGEGFSIQPREAMALGIPVIVTDNTAQSTIAKSGLVCSVPSLTEIPAYYHIFNEYYGMGFDCSIEEIAHALRTVYDNYNDYLQNGSKMREWAKQYRFENLKPLYLSLINPKTVTFGDENSVTSEGITTDSLELFRKYQSLVMHSSSKSVI